MASPPIADTRLSALLNISGEVPVKTADPARASAFASLMRVDGEPEATATFHADPAATTDSAPVETWPTLAPPQLAATVSEPTSQNTDGETALAQATTPATAPRMAPASIETDTRPGIAPSGEVVPQDATTLAVQPKAGPLEDAELVRTAPEAPVSGALASAGQMPTSDQSTAIPSDTPDVAADLPVDSSAAPRTTGTPDRQILSAALPTEAPTVSAPQTSAEPAPSPATPKADMSPEMQGETAPAPKASAPSQPAETLTPNADATETPVPVDAPELSAAETKPAAKAPADTIEPDQTHIAHAAEPTSAEIIPLERVQPASSRAADLHSLIARSLATDRLGSIPRGVSAGEMKLAATHAASTKQSSPAPVTLESLLNREFEIAERLLGEASDLTRSISERAEGKTGFADLLGATTAQSLAARGAPTPGTVIAPTNTPIPQPPNVIAAPADMPAVITRAAGPEGDGADRLVVQLDPPELGRVSIDFRFENNALQGVTVTADTPEALRQLRLMHFDLIQSLESQGHSGLDLSFRQQGGNPSGQAQSYQALGGSRDAPASDATPTPTPARATRENDPSPGKLDITL